MPKWVVTLVTIVALSACDLNDKQRDPSDEQRLLRLIREGETAQVQALVLAGVSPNAVNEIGRSALQIAVSEGNKELLAWLVAHGAKDLGVSSAMAAATYKRDPGMVRLLIEAGFDVDGRDSSGTTPLMSAAFNGDEEIVKMLLDAGADVKAKSNGREQTALINAVHQIALTRSTDRTGPSLIKLLLSHGADVNAVDDQGRSALFYVVPDNFNPIDAWVTDAARLLIEAGAELNMRAADAMTPLLTAAQRGQEVLVELFLEHGADAKVANDHGWTGLMFAAGIGNHAMAKTFLQHGVDVSAKGYHPIRKETWTALWAAVLIRDREMVNLLKSAGAVE